jgi:hypothetical protein
MRVNANDVIQLICKHHQSTSSTRWGNEPVPVWG